MKIGWSTDFIVVDGEKCAADELDRLRGSSAEWVLIERDGGSWRYVFGRQELLTLPHLLALVDQRADLTAMTLTQALGLREGMASVPVVHSSDVRKLASDPARPSAARFVEMERGHPVAVGGADVLPKPRMRSARSASPPLLGTSMGGARPKALIQIDGHPWCAEVCRARRGLELPPDRACHPDAGCTGGHPGGRHTGGAAAPRPCGGREAL